MKTGKLHHLSLELERAQALEVLWPGVFDAGKVRTYWVDVPTGRTGKQNEVILYTLRFDITSGEGETRSFGREEVPACIPSPQERRAPK